mgnify:CR=1 FL=1
MSTDRIVLSDVTVSEKGGDMVKLHLNLLANPDPQYKELVREDPSIIAEGMFTFWLAAAARVVPSNRIQVHACVYR